MTGGIIKHGHAAVEPDPSDLFKADISMVAAKIPESVASTIPVKKHSLPGGGTGVETADSCEPGDQVDSQPFLQCFKGTDWGGLIISNRGAFWIFFS
jgi:hypothetical protein